MFELSDHPALIRWRWATENSQPKTDIAYTPVLEGRLTEEEARNALEIGFRLNSAGDVGVICRDVRAAA
jgi:hypothetical protein